MTSRCDTQDPAMLADWAAGILQKFQNAAAVASELALSYGDTHEGRSFGAIEALLDVGIEDFEAFIEALGRLDAER
jgi:hypothetical protein